MPASMGSRSVSSSLRLSLITLRSRAEEFSTVEFAARKGISSDWKPTRSPRVMLPEMTWAPPTPITAVVISRTDRLGIALTVALTTPIRWSRTRVRL